MNKETSILGITREVVFLTEKEAEPFFSEDDMDNMVNFVKKTSKLMAKEQPNLYEFIRDPSRYVKVNDPLIYGVGVALAYNILSRSLSQEQKTTQIPDAVFPVVYANIIESLEMEGTSDSEKSSINLSWFTEKIKKDSPAFAEWLGSMVSGIEEPDSKSDFIMGVVFVTMPFYMQEEAKRLSSSLSKFPDK